MRDVTDDEFLKNPEEMLNYLRSGEAIVITGQDQEKLILSCSPVTAESLAAADKITKLREKINKMNQSPIVTQARQRVDEQFPALSALRKRALSFEEAMKRTREKHAEVIKRLEDN